MLHLGRVGSLLGFHSKRRRQMRPNVGTIIRCESRRLLSATASYDAGTHTLTLTSTGAESMAVTTNTQGQVLFNKAVVHNGAAPLLAADVHALVVNGGTGSNKIDMSKVTRAAFTTLTSVTINGNAGNDRIIGSEFDDAIHGGIGNDTINGGAGADDIFGEDGNDSVSGGQGDDDIFGGNGNDSLKGDDGNDDVEGEAGDAWLASLAEGIRSRTALR